MKRVFFTIPWLGVALYRSDIGRGLDVYMRRWVLRTPLGMLRVHNILRADTDSAWHDHPTWLLSAVLHGGYVEEVPWVVYRCGRETRRAEVQQAHARLGGYRGKTLRVHDVHYHLAPTVYRIPANRFHRISWVAPNTWTLVVMGPVKDPTWGFLDAHGQYTPFEEHEAL